MNSIQVFQSSALPVLSEPSAEAIALRDAALESSALVGVVRNEAEQTTAVEAMRNLKTVLKEVEKSRQEVKAPVLELAAAIDATAKRFVKDVESEQLRLGKIVGDYQQEQIAIARRKEQERQAELDRIERERRETERKLEEERQRLENAERERRNAEPLKAERGTGNAESGTGNSALPLPASDFSVQLAALEAEQQKAAELNRQAMLAVGPQAAAPKAEGQVVKETFDFEVVDMQLLQRMHPGFVRMEANRSEIMSAIARGVRDIKGLRIVPVVKVNARAHRVPEAIEA